MDSRIFRSVLITVLLSGTGPGTGYAGPSAALGTVESVREVRPAGASSFLGVFELALKPSVVDELLVRLDDGQEIRIVHTGMGIFEPGQRVQVIADPQGARVDRADDHTIFQP